MPEPTLREDAELLDLRLQVEPVEALVDSVQMGVHPELDPLLDSAMRRCPANRIIGDAQCIIECITRRCP